MDMHGIIHNKEKCMNCDKMFSNRSNLRRHVRKYHLDKVEALAPLFYKNENNFAYSCQKCNRNFNHKSSFNQHLKLHNEEELSIHQETSVSNVSKCKQASKKCPLCTFSTSVAEEIESYFKERHEIVIKREELEFTSISEFEQWLGHEEKKTQAKFVKKGTDNCKGHTNKTYVCHRSGFYVPEGKSIRTLKIKGSVKINGYCPAKIKLSMYVNGKCKINYVQTHVGHSHDSNLTYLYLTKEEKQNLAAKIAAKIPFEDILDEVRNSIYDSELQRIHLIRKKDLYNIEQSFNLTSTSIRHSNDAISVELWVNEMNRDSGCILFYKAQGSVSEDCPWLRAEDFVLMVMTPAQCDLLKKFGSYCICLDGTHGLNGYNFELHTILVLDDLREGLPCAFCMSNRSDQDLFKLFFSRVRDQTGIISCNVFMSDLAEGYYNAWNNVMGAAKKRLFCTWHLDRAWRNNLTKIKSKEKQILIYKQLRILLEERDVFAFRKMLNKFCETSSADPETKEFANYFVNNYSKEYEYWAYCCRLHCGINTNMHLERMHKTLKYIYLKGKHVKRLDKALTTLMRFVRDRLIDRVIVINKGKLCTKIKDIRTRHKTSLSLDSNLIIRSEDGWNIPSQKSGEMYLVQELNQNCTCQLICSACDICIHQYCCSCIDSSIKFNICKHIHLLATFRKQENVNNVQQISGCEVELNDLCVHLDKEYINESDAILQQLSHKRSSTSLDEEKETIKKRVCAHLDAIQSPTKLQIMKKVLAPLTPTLSAASSIQNQRFPLPLNNKPHNAKLPVQRRLWSTKKAANTRSERRERPSDAEATTIALDLLL